MKLLFTYLKRHYKIIVLVAFFVGVYAFVFSLYDLPVEAVIYGAILCAFVGLVLFFIGFGSYWRRHKELLRLENTITLSIDELPVPHGQLEKDYQSLLTILHKSAAEAQAIAETKQRDMVDYYTLWAHQIKTPISAMRLLLQDGQGKESSELSAELFRIEQYVEMVLSYLRLDSSSSDYILAEYDLDGIIRQALRKFAKLFILKKLPLEFEETHMKVLTDEKWLLFVIGQLLSNSLKYTVEGHIKIYGKGKSLVIEDTGIGIRNEDIPRVFEKGFTGYNGRENKKSTGIGLYLCRLVCDKLGHGISIQSIQGKGTTVTVDLPEGERIVE